MDTASTRRQLLKLCGATTIAGALAGALRAEGLTSPAPVESGGDGSSAKAPMPFALSTPVHVGEVALQVRDLEAMQAYYSDMLGLSVIERRAGEVTMGAGGVALLHLRHRRSAKLEDMRSAGLYHTAFLMPSRQDLARWLVHVAMNRIPVSGFADHNVSEAAYLVDPEGNGVEVYVDRPPEDWRWAGEFVTMGTLPLDLDKLVAETDPTTDQYTEAPAMLRIGHIHLKVGNVGQALKFYETALGLSPTQGPRDEVAFLSSGRYHHHVAINSWHSAGARQRSHTTTGLVWFSLSVKDEALLAAQEERLRQAGFKTETVETHLETSDPWGTTVRLLKG